MGANPILETQPSNVLETQESNKPAQSSRSSSRSRSASPVKSNKSNKSRSPSPAAKSDKSAKSTTSPVAKSGYDGTPIKEESKKITDFISTCHVRNLSRNCSEEHLEEIFGVYGKILKIQRDKDGPPRGNLGVDKLHCFIDFESLAVAEKVIEHMDGGFIDNNQVEVVIPKIKRTALSIYEREDYLLKKGCLMRDI